MIIARICEGVGNQLFQYAAGRRLAHKHNTELKLDIQCSRMRPYALDQFNISATVATPEEIEKLKSFSEKHRLGRQSGGRVIPEFFDWPDNIYLHGQFINKGYFADIMDIILKEITLKNPSKVAQSWMETIRSAECSLSMHFRHGDFVYHPGRQVQTWRIEPFDFYVDCLNTLKQYYPNPTVFVFSDNIPYLKDNLHLDVPTYFIEGCEHDVEEICLMGLCQHNIIAHGSTFSTWGVLLNQNPDRKIFFSAGTNASVVQEYRKSLSPTKVKMYGIDDFLCVPFDVDKRPDVEQRPIFSFCLVVNDDAATIAETLDSLLSQDYKYYEIIIIDNASTDGSYAICREKIADRKNVIFKRLHSKTTNAKAWNMAIEMAQGCYVCFLKGNDRFVASTLSTSYYLTERRYDIIVFATYLEESDSGNVVLNYKKFSNVYNSFFGESKFDIIVFATYLEESDSGNVVLNYKKFSNVYSSYFGEKVRDVPSTNGFDAAKFSFNKQMNTFLGARFFYRDFLLKNKIKFDKNLDAAEAELLFQVNAFLHTKYFVYNTNAFYIAPKNN